MHPPDETWPAIVVNDDRQVTKSIRDLEVSYKPSQLGVLENTTLNVHFTSPSETTNTYQSVYDSRETNVYHLSEDQINQVLHYIDTATPDQIHLVAEEVERDAIIPAALVYHTIDLAVANAFRGQLLTPKKQEFINLLEDINEDSKATSPEHSTVEST